MRKAAVAAVILRAIEVAWAEDEVLGDISVMINVKREKT